MSLTVIKFVAGGGKTTESKRLITSNKNCIYLAFNNKVVDEVSNEGFLSKTIDSLFVSYIIPKLIDLIPLISHGSKIEYVSSENIPAYLKGVSNIKIKSDGFLYNKTHKTSFELGLENIELHQMNGLPNLNFIKYIFGKDKIVLTDQLRSDLCNYLLDNYADKIKDIIEDRFNVLIIDESQDLKGYHERFAKLLAESNVNLYLLGDDYQNINGGGEWFENLEPHYYKNQSYRCPDDNCKWIRDNMRIDIYGVKSDGGVCTININQVNDFDDSRRTLLYQSATANISEIINNWKGPKYTIKKSKGMTIDEDVVILGKTLNSKNMYTAITRTRKRVYLTAKLI
jgi:hypothetical protein